MLAVGFVEATVWVVAAAIILLGACGVVFLTNPVHNALSLVATLFGVAILFVVQEAYFLAVIQVIVYAGAIVVLFLFVIMLLGVDRIDRLGRERKPWRRPVAAVSAGVLAALVLLMTLTGVSKVTGAPSQTASLHTKGNNIQQLGRVLFTDYVWAFEITAVLLTIAVIGAVMMSRRSDGTVIDLEEFVLDDDEDIDDEELDDDDEYAEYDVITGERVNEPDVTGIPTEDVTS
jgi:NADH-quinone oxidoreductase subunit J